ncbi:hypothetical protein [Fontibacillus sp. BL9]|uniref:hypothetical protein n=1 Tax=Fontibacillus sp. BL9 TaxID=3389971 RepID=UPI00397D0600
MLSFSNSIEKRTRTIRMGYLILMTLVFYAYALLDNHRLNQSDYWASKSRITQEDVEAIQRLGTWVTSFEELFFAEFVIAFIVVHIYTLKNNKISLRFIGFNAALFMGIALINFIVFLATSMPIGNLMQPLLLPSSMVIVLFVYVQLLKLKK